MIAQFSHFQLDLFAKAPVPIANISLRVHRVPVGETVGEDKVRKVTIPGLLILLGTQRPVKVSVKELFNRLC